MIERKETQQIKGIAIMMMLFLHLFNTPERIELCTSFLYFWNGKPLAYAMSRAMGFCVPIYIFLSGYGLSIIYERDAAHKLHVFRRIKNLYLNYWIVFILFIPLAAYLRPDIYTVDVWNVFLNFIGVRCNYNYEWWFLFPYILFVLSSPFIIKMIYEADKRKNIKQMVLISVIYLCSELIRKAPVDFFGKQLLVRLFFLFFPFAIGIIFVKYRLFGYFKTYFSKFSVTKKLVSLYGILLFVVLLRMMLGPSFINPLLTIPFLVCIACLRRPLVINKILEFLGYHSANMWLTHTFFSWYLFSEYFYGLKYPLVIYLALLIVSVCTSCLIMPILKVLHLNKAKSSERSLWLRFKI